MKAPRPGTQALSGAVIHFHDGVVGPAAPLAACERLYRCCGIGLQLSRDSHQQASGTPDDRSRRPAEEKGRLEDGGLEEGIERTGPPADPELDHQRLRTRPCPPKAHPPRGWSRFQGRRRLRAGCRQTSGLNPVSELRCGVWVNFGDSGGEAGAGIFRRGYGQASQVKLS